MNSGQACRPFRGSCSHIPGRGCFGDLPGDEIVVSPASPIVEPLTSQVVMRQVIIWHPTADAGEAVSSDTATREGGGRDTDIIRRDPRKPPTTRPHWGVGRPSRRRRNRNSMSRRGRVSWKVRLSWREWSMRRGELLGRRGQLRRS